MAVPSLLHTSHEVLNVDFCSGYVDAFGKWNTGFPCPWLESTVPGLCCGTDTYKYCCTGKEKIDPSPTVAEDPLLLVLAITLGVAAGITLLILVACFVCPGCLLHQKRRPGPLYRLPCSSTMSTYVPATTAAGSQRADVRTSGSSQSFSHCGVSSMYSLSEPIFRAANQQPVQSNSNSNSNSHSSSSGDNDHHHHHHHQQEHHHHHQRPEDPARACHHLYWNRAQQPAAAATPTRNNQGSERACREDSSPPPPYEANFHSIVPVADIVERPRTALQHLHPNSTVRHHISPRQPALCIIDEGRRDGPHMTYHSTKF